MLQRKLKVWEKISNFYYSRKKLRVASNLPAVEKCSHFLLDETLALKLRSCHRSATESHTSNLWLQKKVNAAPFFVEYSE